MGKIVKTIENFLFLISAYRLISFYCYAPVWEAPIHADYGFHSRTWVINQADRKGNKYSIECIDFTSK